MNIGIVTTWFERGAAYVSSLYLEALQNDHQVFIYARGGEKYAIGDPNWDLPCVWWGKKLDCSIEYSRIHRKDFLNWLNTKKIDLVIFNEQTYWAPILWCRDRGIRTVAYVDYYTEPDLPLFVAYDALICNTRRHYETFEWHPQAYYVPWGTNTEVFTPAADYAAPIDANRPVRFFLSCGMAPRRKGVDLLLEAFCNMKQNALLTLHTQRDLMEQLPAPTSVFLETLQQQGRLNVVQQTIGRPGLYHQHDVYIYPARLDGLGLTVAEALSSGMAAIVTNSAPMNEFVSADCGATIPVKRYYCRGDAYYYPMSDVDIGQLTELLDRFAGDRELVTRCKINARQYALNYLNWEKNQKGLLACIKKIKPIALSPEDRRKIENFDRRGFRKCRTLFYFLQNIRQKLKTITSK